MKHTKGNRVLAKMSFKTAILILIAASISACGKDSAKQAEAAGPTCKTLAGHYYDTYSPANTLDVADDCTFHDSYCGYTASYTVPASTGASIVTVAGTNGTPGCMSSTAHACTIGYNNVQLSINCDSGSQISLFTK